MKFQFPQSQQLGRNQLLAIGGGLLVVAAAAGFYFFYKPGGEPAAEAAPAFSAAQAKARRDSLIKARQAGAAGAVAQSGKAKDSAGKAVLAKDSAARLAKPAAAAKDSAAAAPAARTVAAKDSAAKPAADSAAIVVQRESFEFNPESRRDPFVSLMASEDLRPAVSDLRLSGILWHPTRPIAVLRDISMKDQQYRVTVGSALGRMRVTQIRPRAVIFTIEEFGFNRRDSLILGDTTQVRAR